MILARQVVMVLGAALLLCLVVSPTPSAGGQEAAITAPPQSVTIPPTATTLEGIPTVRIDVTEERASRQVLDEAEALKNRLTVRVIDGKLYWASRENRLLQLDLSGEFTYLTSDPGHYIRLRQLNDTISYVEHVQQAFGSVTYVGELRIVLGK